MTKPSASSLRKLPAILVVDDEIRSQEALRRTLEEDFDVLCASGADEGMAILEREQPVSGIRIVLCDQRMPGTTGVQFLKEVRDRWPDIVRIILSGYTDAEDIITELLARVEPAIEAVTRQLPPGFPQDVAVAIFEGVRKQVKRLEGQPST